MNSGTAYNETIAAIATPAGRGGIGIVRLSGPKVPDIAKKILGYLPGIRKADYVSFKDQEGHIIDFGLAIRFVAPKSFTGEDILELHGHGGPIVLDTLLKSVINLGARIARPGEFTERAFHNKKIDLVQAEAVAELIDASSQQAARAALRSLQGIFSKKITQLIDRLVQLRLYVEAAIDFPEEDINFLANSYVHTSLDSLLNDIQSILLTAQQGQVLSEGMSLVLVGRPNAGKSSLLNLFAGEQAAIVTHIPGTTRDVIKVKVNIDGLLLNVMDTAGLRETQDVVEREGVERALNQVELADLVLLVIDGSVENETNPFILHPNLSDRLPGKAKIIVVYNKIDQIAVRPEVIDCQTHFLIKISAKTGAGISNLKDHIKSLASFTDGAEQQFIARRRHVNALEQAQVHIKSGLQQLSAPELLAEELKTAQDFLSNIAGKFTSNDLLGRIFSEFCIGK